MSVSPMKTWYTIRAARKTAELRIYDEIGLWGVSAKQLLDELTALGDLQRLDVRIHSPGGDVYDALAIHNALQRYGGPITVHIDGLCASAATVVALAGDEVRMVSNGQFMIHEPWTVTAGDADDHQRRADLLDKTADQIVGIYARKSGLDAPQIRELMRAETWMSAQQAFEQGFIDAIDEPLRIAARVFDLSRFTHPPRGVSMAEVADPAIPEDAVQAEPETPEEAAAASSDPPTDSPPPTAPVEKGAEPAPADPGLPPALVASTCLDAREEKLIPVLLQLGATLTMTALRARLQDAKEIRGLCAAVKQPAQADDLIAAGLSVEQVKLRLWDALVALDTAVGDIDATPPAPAAARDPQALAQAARQYQQAQAQAGTPVSAAVAVAHVLKGAL